MEIIINESEAEFLERIEVDDSIRSYWEPLTPIKKRIKYEALQGAQSDGLNYLEILVKNILNPQIVDLEHQFKRRKSRLGNFILNGRIVVSHRVLDKPAFTSIVQSVLLSGEGTTFRFLYPVKKLLEAQHAPVESLNEDWFYTLGKEGEKVFLLLYSHLPLHGDTVSCGVKIPSGRA